MKDFNEFPPCLTLPKMMVIFDSGETTICRWNKEAWEGKRRFPRSLDMKRNGGNGKGKLLWSRESVIAFLNGEQSKEPQPPPSVKSAPLRNKRHRQAMDDLKIMGVKVKDTE